MQNLDKPRDHRVRTGLVSVAGHVALMLAVAGLAGCGDSGSTDSPAPATSSPPSAAVSPASPAATSPAAAPAAASGDADQMWSAYEEMFRNPPQPPASWNLERPSEEAIREFQLSRGEAATKLAQASRDFYTKFPDDPRAETAKQQEIQLLTAAIQLGYTNASGRLDELTEARLKDPNTTEDERLQLRMSSAHRKAASLIPQGEEVVRESLEQSAKDLIKEFPKRPEPYHLLLNLVADGPEDKVRATVTPLLSADVPEQVRTSAQSLLNRYDLVGKPLDLKFTALDGREVDLEKMRGKVILIDFWATWCGPCIAELPNVKAAYERLHPQGFEILGISFDHDKDALVELVEKEKMTWPQYFDGKGWENAFGKRFGIEGIPTMWLIDKKGVLRDLNGRDDLEAKVTKLLAEDGQGAG